jgi:ankyrin repeat protein
VSRLLAQIITAQVTNQQDRNGDTPLHLAFQFTWLDAVPMLLTNEADVNIPNHDGVTALQEAFRVSTRSCIVPKCSACHHRKRRWLGSVHAGNEEPERVLKQMLEKASRGSFVLRDTEGRTVLHDALSIRHVPEDIVATIVSKTTSAINDRIRVEDTALHLAAKSLVSNFVRILVEHGADVNVTNKDGNTPLMTAIRSALQVNPVRYKKKEHLQKELISIIGYLVDKGSNVNLQNNDGDTALLLAAKVASVPLKTIIKLISLKDFIL